MTSSAEIIPVFSVTCHPHRYPINGSGHIPGVAPQPGHFFPQNAECYSSFNIDFKIIIFKDIIENCLNKNFYFITFIKILTFWLRKTPFLGDNALITKLKRQPNLRDFGQRIFFSGTGNYGHI